MYLLRTLMTYGSPVLAVVALLAAMHTTSPLSAGPAGILLVMSLVYLAFVLVMHALVMGIVAILAQYIQVPSYIKRRLRYMVTVLGFGPVLLIALNSIGQTGALGVVLVAIFMLLGCFYVARRLGYTAGTPGRNSG